MSGSLDTTSDRGGRNFFRSSEWVRAGRGHELQFFALDEELDEWLADLSAAESGLLLAGFDLVESEPRQFRELLFVCPSVRVTDCLVDPTGRRRNNLWIAAERLTPRTALGAATGQKDLAVNGLILVQPGSTRKGLVDASRIAIVEKIENMRTGELHAHVEHMKLFNALARRIRANLVLKTKSRQPNALASTPRMTARAGAAAGAGQVAFIREPAGND